MRELVFVEVRSGRKMYSCGCRWCKYLVQVESLWEHGPLMYQGWGVCRRCCSHTSFSDLNCSITSVTNSLDSNHLLVAYIYIYNCNPIKLHNPSHLLKVSNSAWGELLKVILDLLQAMKCCATKRSRAPRTQYVSAGNSQCKFSSIS